MGGGSVEDGGREWRGETEVNTLLRNTCCSIGRHSKVAEIRIDMVFSNASLYEGMFGNRMSSGKTRFGQRDQEVIAAWWT